jgi:hydrogenase maturation protease
LNEGKKGARVLVIGVGNDFRSDDAVGLAVARRLEEQDVHGIAIVEAPGEGASLVDAWDGTDAVILIDAVRSGSVPGTIHRLPRRALTRSADIFLHSTHAISISDAIELARAMKRLPKRLIVVGIEGEDFRAGLGLSQEVKAAVSSAVDAVLEEAKAMMRPSRVLSHHA